MRFPIAPLLLVPLLAGCMGALPGLAAVGATSLANTPQGSTNFDSVTYAKSPATSKQEEVITVRGSLTWKPPWTGSSAQFMVLSQGQGLEVELYDSKGDLLARAVEPPTFTDGAETITAVPPNRSVRFVLKSSVPANISRAIASVRMRGVGYLMPGVVR